MMFGIPNGMGWPPAAPVSLLTGFDLPELNGEKDRGPIALLHLPIRSWIIERHWVPEERKRGKRRMCTAGQRFKIEWK